MSTAAGSMGAVDRWQWQLVERVGLSEGEAKGLLDGLHAFCERHGADPDTVLARWESYPELTVRRRQSDEFANLPVESFLIHNGVMIFGDILCVPARPEDLAAQGAQFGPRRA